MKTGSLDAAGAEALVAALSDDSPAYLLRIGLEHALSTGMPFDEAWPAVLKGLGRGHGRASEVWRSTKPTWEAAYNRRRAALLVAA